MTEDEKALIQRARTVLDYPKRDLRQQRDDLGTVWNKLQLMGSGNPTVRSIKRRINRALNEVRELQERLASK